MAITTKSMGFYLVEPTGNETLDTARFAEAKDSGLPIVLKNDGVTPLRVGAQTTFGDRDIFIDGNHATIVATANIIPILINKSTPASLSVASIADVLYDLDGTGTNTTLVSRLTMTNPADANVVVGEFYKITSADKAPGGSIGQNSRMGEIMRVVAVDVPSGFIYLNSTLYRRDVYATTIQATRYKGQDYTTRIRNIRFRADDAGIAGNWNVPQMWIETTHFMELHNIEITQSFGSGIFMLNNYGADVTVNVRQIRYNIGLGSLGYGVVTSADNHCNFAIRGRNCRHSFTDAWTNGATGSVYRRGPSLYGRITGHADGCFAAGFDMHDSSARSTFVNIVSSNNIDGEQALGCGIQMRGFQNTAYNCVTIGNEWGVQLFENNDNGSDDLSVVNHFSDDKQGCLVITGRSTSASKMKVRVKGGLFRWSNGVAGVLANDADMSFQDSMFAPRYTGGGEIFALTNRTELRGTVVWDGADAGGTWVMAATSGSANNIRISGVRSDDSTAEAGDANYIVKDLTPDRVNFSAALTTTRTVTFACVGVRRCIIFRSGAGAGSLDIIHSGGTLSLVGAGNFAMFEIIAGRVLLSAQGTF